MAIPTHETIEQAVKALDTVYEQLPDSDDTRQARHWLDVSGQHAHNAREQATPAPVEE